MLRSVAVVSTVVLSVYVLLDVLFLSEYLFHLSIPFENTLQQNYPSWQLYFQVIARLGNEGIQVLLLCVYLFASDRLQSLTLLLNVFMCVGVSQLMKLSYSHPRPYWVSDQVHGLGCETGFGHPSGHSGPPLFVLYVLYTTYLRPISTSRVVHMAMCLVLICFQLNVVASRLYLGVHGIDQVVLGTLQGLHWCCFYSSLSHDAIRNMLLKFNRTAQHPTLRTKYLLLLLCCQAMLLVVVLSISYHVQQNVQVLPEWVERMNQACNRIYTKDTPKIKGLKGAGALFTPFAFGMGVIWRAAIFKKQQEQGGEYTPASKGENHFQVLVVAVVVSVVLDQWLPHGSMVSGLNYNWLLPINLMAVVPWVLWKSGLGGESDLSDLEEGRQYSFLENL